ncbi:mediator of RNA polymerase II transcription subunit 16 [Podospora conica]|nr:mediator of RNA polymerase II transcription subunit 16 [Schizothecium conicum]
MSVEQMAGLLLSGSMSMDVDASMTAMDDTMGLDEVDLFGDPVLSPPPPSRALQQRISDLRTRGAAHSIAWSKQGTIASVSKDGSSLELRFLRCHPETGQWELGPPTSCSQLPPPPGGAPIVNIAWAATSNNELAVIDAAGRIAILSVTISLNRAYPSRRWDADHDDIHPIVGCYWLPLPATPANRPYLFSHGPAVWNQTEYKFETSAVAHSAPYHPNPGKSALFCVTANGFLKLLYVQNNNRMEETSLELESVACSDDMITHASICSDKNLLIIVIATASKQLKVLKVATQWSPPQPGDKQAPPGSVTLSPSLMEKHLAISTWYQPFPSATPLDPLMTQLSHIEMLPSFHRGSSTPDAPPLVLTVRSFLPAYGSLYNQGYQSIIDRWELVAEPQALHPAFAQLSQKTGQTSQLPPSTGLKKLEPIVVPKIVISIHIMQLGRVLCFAFSDGTFQYRDRLTMDEIYHVQDLSRITSPLQVGFHFEPETPCLEVAFSPNNCSFVQINENWTARWNKMQYTAEPMVKAEEGNQHDAILAALSVSLSAGFHYQTNFDDVLAIARPFADRQEFVYKWLRSVSNMVKVLVDYSEETYHDQLVRNHPLAFCLSIMNHLGFHGESKPRAFYGKFAMLTLNLRNVVLLITIANNAPGTLKEKLNPLDDPDVVTALAGCANWAVTLISWLAGCLLDLQDDATFRAILADPKRFAELAGHMHTRGNVALHLLLCSSTRGFLSAVCRRLAILEDMCHKAVKYFEGRSAAATNTTGTADRRPDLYYAYVKMMRAISSGLVKFQDFNKLLTALGEGVRVTYREALGAVVAQQQQGQQQQEQFVKKAQAHAELDMLLGGNPPSSFREMLDRFFAVNVRAFGEGCDRAKLYFGNYDILEITDEHLAAGKGGAGGKAPVRVDVFTRTPVKPAVPKKGTGADQAVVQWRRCVRCASVMEDKATGRGWGPGFVFVLAQQRRCSCMGNWAIPIAAGAP